MLQRVILSGGGTGGHIFPALAIADALKARNPGIEIHFVGASGAMETRLIPPAGYPLQVLPIRGLQRSLTPRNLVRNLALPFRLAQSYYQAWKLLRRLRPQVVVGVGGYASFPVVRMAAALGIPTALQEQNAYAGLSNRALGRQAQRIFLGNEAARKYFPADKCLYTGNPLRAALKPLNRTEACARLGLDPQRPVLLITGGSLGARSLNEGVVAGLDALKAARVQVLWQCGRGYHAQYSSLDLNGTDIRLLPFIDDMAACYGAADLVVCRAGALTLTELQELRKPAILIPSPFVAEDHQTHNARSLADRGAALLLPDTEARHLVSRALELIQHPEQLAQLSQALEALPRTRAADVIARELESIARPA
jgi:UDP-N-acetylglucosamine--N-acetylmuramyl-(pentapeptide) pyrophosphoryl-undecaprenol N-acetylglucosamine transferase